MNLLVKNTLKIIYPVAIYFFISFGIYFIIDIFELEFGIENFNKIFSIEQVISLGIIIWIYKIQSSESIMGGKNYKLHEYGVINIILIFITPYFVLNTIGLFIIVLRLNEFFSGYLKLSTAFFSGAIFFQIIAIGMLAPILEELLFRGIVYNRLREISNFYISAVISSLIWAIVHLNVVQGVTTFLFGIFLAFLYEKYKMLWVTIISHVIFNLISVVSWNLSFSPDKMATNVGSVDTSYYISPMIINIIILSGLILFIKYSKFPCKQKKNLTYDINKDSEDN